ncbi:MAG: PorV/PorQ family protein [Ignavibacteriaceae bacterium]
MKLKFLLTSTLILIISVYLFPQSKNVSKVGTTAATFLEIGVGASASGMGGAFVSMAGDATSLYWNPAGIARLDQNEVIFTHTNWIASTNLDYAALVLPLGELGNIGLSYTSLSMPDMPVTTVEMPQGTGEYFSAGDLALGLSYARTITDRFSIGFTAKYIQENIWHETGTAFAVDAGTSFRTDLLGGMVIGASISNFGTAMQLSGIDTRTFARVDPTKLGSNDQVPYNIELESWNLPLLFRIGVSASPINTESYKWTIAVDALHPNDNYESMNIGTELSYHGFLFIRGGYQSLFLPDGEGGLSFGIGVNTKELFSNEKVRFDYAYRDFGRLSGVHYFSVGINF